MAKVRMEGLNFASELEKMIDEFTNEIFEKREEALDKAADYMVEKFKQATPVDTGNTKNSWIRTDKYKSVRFIGNTSLTTRGRNKNIPVTNVLEFSKKHGKPFMLKTWEQEKDNLLNIIKEEFKK